MAKKQTSQKQTKLIMACNQKNKSYTGTCEVKDPSVVTKLLDRAPAPKAFVTTDDLLRPVHPESRLVRSGERPKHDEQYVVFYGISTVFSRVLYGFFLFFLWFS